MKSLLRWVQWFLLALWCLLLVLVGVQLAQRNAQQLSVDLLVWQTPDVPLGLLVCALLLGGFLLGLVAVIPLGVAQRLRIRSLRRQLDHATRNPSKGLVGS